MEKDVIFFSVLQLIIFLKYLLKINFNSIFNLNTTHTEHIWQLNLPKHEVQEGKTSLAVLKVVLQIVVMVNKAGKTPLKSRYNLFVQLDHGLVLVTCQLHTGMAMRQ